MKDGARRRMKKGGASVTDATTGVTVLIVEDDAHISGIVADCLGNAG